MKLVELLEQGKKATRDGLLERDCLHYVQVVDGIISGVDDVGVHDVGVHDVNITLNALIRDDWYEYNQVNK